MSKYALLLLAVLSGSLAWTPDAGSQEQNLPETTNRYIQQLESPFRAEWQKPDEVVRTLDLHGGERIANVGAGSGYFTLRFARKVGAAGKVYAADIEQEMLDYIEQRAKQENLRNIQTILAGLHDPSLKPASVDLVFMCATLYNITDRPEYYPLLAKALRPGGKLVIIDFQKQLLPPIGPPFELKIAREDVISEVETAGFHLTREFDFLPHQYFLVFGSSS